MRVLLIALCLGLQVVYSASQFNVSNPQFHSSFDLKAKALCATAKETLAYLNRGYAYDSEVIHEGKQLKISVERVKATLIFICKHQSQLNDPQFIKDHFDFIRWYPDVEQIRRSNRPLVFHLPRQNILMT